MIISGLRVVQCLGLSGMIYGVFSIDWIRMRLYILHCALLCPPGIIQGLIYCVELCLDVSLRLFFFFDYTELKIKCFYLLLYNYL